MRRAFETLDRFGEADLIVVFLTRDRGKRRGVARNAVKSRRRFGAGLDPLNNPGPHGLSEILYAFASGSNNNGSAFAGLDSSTTWYATTMGIAMLVGRFFLIIPVLAIAASMARKQPSPPSAGTFPTHTPLFGGLVVGVVLIVAGLTFFPVLALGPIVEQLSIR